MRFCQHSGLRCYNCDSGCRLERPAIKTTPFKTLLIGWSFDQWSQAVAWFARVKGFTPLPTLNGAYQVHYEWKLRHEDEPGERRLILVDEWKWNQLGEPCIETNVRWTFQLFAYGARHGAYVA